MTSREPTMSAPARGAHRRRAPLKMRDSRERSGLARARFRRARLDGADLVLVAFDGAPSQSPNAPGGPPE